MVDFIKLFRPNVLIFGLVFVSCDFGLHCLVRELSPSLQHKPAINYLLTFTTLLHTQLLDIIFKHFYSALVTDFSFYRKAF